jgi:gliding motility-associated-like protein
MDASTPDTSIVGTTIWYVSQTVNNAESELVEVVIEVHPLPEQPKAIVGKTLIGAGTTQAYSVVNGSSDLTYQWVLPAEFVGNSTENTIDVQVGTKSGVIEVYTISSMGCESSVQELEVRVVVEGDLEVFNALSPNGDGINDVFTIRNIDFYPNNSLYIYNRWGVEVYKANGYGQNGTLFRGFSDGRNTINRDSALPDGTYFYTLTYKNTTGRENNLSGYLYIKN